MKIQQYHYLDGKWNNTSTSPDFDNRSAQLVLAFGEPSLINNKEMFNHIRGLYAEANIVACSTAGEIISDEVHDKTIVLTAIQFEKTTIRGCVTNISRHKNSHEAGQYLMNELLAEDLNSVFVISDG